MNEIIELIERMIDVWCMKRYLKKINKNLRLYDKYKDKARIHKEVARKLLDDFNELYPNTTSQEEKANENRNN